MDKSNLALFASGLNFILLGTLMSGASMPAYSGWVVCFLGLMIMMFTLAPHARSGKK